jgi:hypothetical protein
MKAAATPHHEFFPYSEVDRLVNVESVTRELELCSRLVQWTQGVRPRAQATEICRPEEGKSYRRIFAILVMLGLPLRIHRFLKHGISDDMLPFEGREAEKGPYKLFPMTVPTTGTQNAASKMASGSGPGVKTAKRKPLKCFRGWKDFQKRRFEETQWKFAAPFFARSAVAEKPIQHVDLPDKAILPFTSWTWIDKGGSGEVFHTEIHAAHHGFGSDDAQQVSRRMEVLQHCSASLPGVSYISAALSIRTQTYQTFPYRLAILPSNDSSQQTDPISKRKPWCSSCSVARTTRT